MNSVFDRKVLATALLALISVAVTPITQDQSDAVRGRWLGASSVAHAAEAPATEALSGLGLAAMERAEGLGKYLFVFFYSADDQQTDTMRRTFESVMGNVSHRAESILINVTDPTEKGIVDKFGASRAPMPLVLVLAPNGAIVSSFATSFSEEQLMGAFASPSMEKCLKALQEEKLVLLCVQNGSTSHNDEAMQGVHEFQTETKYAGSTEVVVLDPADPEEVGFLGKLKVDPGTEEAITLFLAPPGAVIGQYTGATDKGTFVKTLQAALSKSGCGPNSSPGCCPPKGKK